MPVSSQQIKGLAAQCGFELAGFAPARPHPDFERFERWRGLGFAGDMRYLTDHRGDIRADPRNLLPSAMTVLCLGKLYNTGPAAADDSSGISRYAWGKDYHDLMRDAAGQLVERIQAVHEAPFESRICVDTAPLLERSYAAAAGLGWIGKNTCLIHQQSGSWFFLCQILLSFEVAPDVPAPNRCGTCTRCIDACPTTALVPDEERGWTVDSRRCISYLTIEKRGELDEAEMENVGTHVFGCDICQDVCPWNGRAPTTAEVGFVRSDFSRELVLLAGLSEEEFRTQFRSSPVWRSKHEGFLRNVAVALGNSGQHEPVLDRLALHPSPVVSKAARRALNKLRVTGERPH